MAESSSDVIVVGGGIAGLATAGALGRHGIAVALLEARDRLGGRVFTARPRGWRGPVELGAEFIHQGNDALKAVLRRHKLRPTKVPESHWRYGEGGIRPIADVTAAIGSVTDAIEPRRMRGWSFADFLRRKHAQFPPEQRELTEGFVEGFEAAPLQRMSAPAMKGETLDTSEQFRLEPGYDRLVNALVTELAARQPVKIHRGSIVRAIAWERGAVRVQAGKTVFRARAAVVTLPLGVLQARTPQRGAVRFTPGLGAKAKLIARMQMGHVMRLTLRFDADAWPLIVPLALQDGTHAFGFVHSAVDGVPVWWSLDERFVITGWAGGPAGLALADRSERGIRQRALRSLCEVFGTPTRVLQRALRDFAAHNWSRDPFSRGAYSFTAAGLDDAAEKLREPIGQTLFFAGEATADGEEVGTVHGALASGLRAAEEVRTALR